MHAPIGTPVRCPVLVGRVTHMDALRKLLEAANGERGQIALISGEAGVGKSRLTAEIAAAARMEGFFVLQGRCFEQHALSPYTPLIDLLRVQFAWHPLPAHAADLEPAARELLLLLPGIVPPPRDLVVEPVIDPETHWQRLVAALSHHLLSLASHQPLLLIFEDLQWSDDASLEVLLHLTRLSTARPICLLATYRSDDAGTRLQHWLAQIDRERAALEIRLARLTADEVAAMLEAIFALNRPPRPEFVETLFSLTEGNPFFIEEVLTALIAAGDIFYGTSGWDRKPVSGLRIPRSVQDAVRRRVEGLSEPAKQALMLAAVIGTRFDYLLLSALTHLDDQTLMPAVKQLIGAQLVVEETADQFAFRHALTRQAVYADLLARERRVLHRTVAELMESQDDSDAQDRRLGELAYHYTEAQVWTKALAYARQAGDQARMLYAPQAAVEQYTRALVAAAHVSPAPAAELHRARAASFEMLGDLAAARSDYADALRLAQIQQDGRAQWEALLALGALHAGTDYSQAGRYVAQALDLAREMSDPLLVARSLNRVGNWHLNAERPEPALALHVEALAAAEAACDRGAIAETLDLLGMTYNILGDPRLSSAYYGRAIPLFRELGDREGLVNSQIIQVLQSGSYWHDTLVPAILSLEDATSAQEEALRTSREMGWPTGESYVLYESALWHGPRGNYARALDMASSGLAIAERIDHRQWMLGCHATLAALCLELFALPTARHHAERALTLAHELGSRLWAAIVSAVLACIWVHQRDFSAAVATLDATAGTDAPMRTLGDRMLWCARGELQLARGDADGALSIVDRLIAADPNAAPDAVVPRLWRMRGEAFAALRQRDEAEGVFLTARDAAARAGLRPVLWRIHLSLAHLYRATRRQRDSAREFTSARRLVDELAAEIVDESLRDAFLNGTAKLFPLARPTTQLRAAKQAFGGLTQRECEIVQLIAEGRSNAEIAAVLVLGKRTVETHISSILGKLGVTSRAQVVTWAVTHGLVRVAP